ncbi:MAG: FHA domain-containing protein [Gammaproteobacteria bacterium]|nr:FHA domain-containing protein [Gammaproteobacteria bacterium]
MPLALVEFNSILRDLEDAFDAVDELITSTIELHVLIVSAVSIVVGLLSAYYGLKIYKVLVFLLGAVLGGVLGALIGGAAGALILGIVGGFVLLACAYLIPVGLGFLVGFAAAFIWMQPEDAGLIVPLAAGVLGAVVAKLIYELFLIIGFAVSGAALVAGSVYRLLDTFSRSLVDTTGRLVVAALVFVAIVITGILKQYGVVRRDKAKPSDTAAESEDLVPEEPSASSDELLPPFAKDPPASPEPRQVSIRVLPDSDDSWCLLGSNGPNRGEVIDIGNELLIGRDVVGGLSLDDPSVSRVHAMLETFSDGRLLLTDLGSTHGTWVNGTRIEKSLLRPGDGVRFHEHAFRVAWRSELRDGQETVNAPIGK